jgi:hypothetical protein
MSIRHAPAAALLALCVAAIFPVATASAQEPSPGLADRFSQICGTTAAAGPGLPGTDVASADAPGFFAADLRRATDSHVVKIDDVYAMRAIVPSDFDPQYAVFLKCAVASPAAFAQQADRLSTILSAKPATGKTGQGFDYARFSAGTTTFVVFGEADNWVSIYKIEIMMRNIDPKYLKRGAKPAPAPSVR